MVLLPPSEGKAKGGVGPSRSAGCGEGAFGQLGPARHELVSRLDPGIDDLPTMCAIDRYTGVLCTALSYPTLDGWARRRANASVVVLSGLWGALAPTDPIPDYTLPIGTSVRGLGGLAAWWRPRVTPVIDQRAAGNVVWDLLPVAHAAMWDDSAATYRARWRVRVVREAADGTRITVSHDNKATKGYLARYIMEAGPRSPKDLVEIELPGGYRVDTSNPDWGKRGGLVEIVQSWR